MKCQSKINVNIVDGLDHINEILIKGHWYECELTPTIQDPMTFKPTEPYYIVTCEDGKFRKYKTDNFLTLAEVRDEKLQQLGI